MGRKKIYSDDLNPQIKQLYESGKSLNEIRTILGVHPEIAKRRLIHMGIEVRNKSDAMVNFHAQKKRQRKNSQNHV
ncbi:MAG: hypothetical protein ACXADW_19085 [Candidatus Hodarchaeales archaeon]|jgi:hypothetical protein